MFNENLNHIYWQVFKNLEQDFIKVADVIHVDDNQQEVYSMKIADLLIRTVIEIEALAKELMITGTVLLINSANEGTTLSSELQ